MYRLIAHAGEEHVKDPSTLAHHWPAILGLTLAVALAGYFMYQFLKINEQPVKEKDED